MSLRCPHCNAKKFPGETPMLCCHKRILPAFPRFPVELADMYRNNEFLKDITLYNSAFSFTSLACKEIRQDQRRNYDNYRIQGRLYHRMPSVLVASQTSASELQIYFLDDAQDRANSRRSIVSDVLRLDNLELIQGIIVAHNRHYRNFKTARDYMLNNPVDEQRLVLVANPHPSNGEHAGRYNVPVSNDIAVLMPDDVPFVKDLVLRRCDDTYEYISDLNEMYDSLQYPLLFPFGTLTYGPHLTVESHPGVVSTREYYAYYLMIRTGDEQLHMARRLYLQFIVDAYTKVESNRLNFHTNVLRPQRTGQYQQIVDQMRDEDLNPDDVGQRIILSPSYTGGPRYMFEKQLNALTYVNRYGRPTLFVTMTCNPSWREITENLPAGQKFYDRPDITSRVFRLKLKEIIQFFKLGKMGEVIAYLYSVEFQKRGLPHAHILIWLLDGQSIRSNRVDELICAEIPDIDADPELFAIVTANMVHGHSPACQTTAVSRCSKGFPKAYAEETRLDSRGRFPLYRRRSVHQGGRTAFVRGQHITNANIVPYNPFLSRYFACHINVELCTMVRSIRYVLKYVNKGSDKSTFVIRNPGDNLDEIREYRNARYVGSNEATWRILDFPIHENFPSVLVLPIHLPNCQQIIYDPNHPFDLNNAPSSKLMDFFRLCTEDAFASSLFYYQVTHWYAWNKKWQRRLRGGKNAQLGRISQISPKAGELFYLRLLLIYRVGPKSFEHLRTIGGVLRESFMAAASAMGILDDDQYLVRAIEDAVPLRSANRLRRLFAVILLHCEPKQPVDLWNRFRDSLCVGLSTDRNGNTDENRSRALLLIARNFDAIGGRLASFPIPHPEFGTYDRQRIERVSDAFASSQSGDAFADVTLNSEQTEVFDRLRSMIVGGRGGIMFVDAPGGTGKTFLINYMISYLTRNVGPVLATASSGIASTLLSGGRTLHSTFNLPLNISRLNQPAGNISRSTEKARRIENACVLFIDEAPSLHRNCIEGVDFTLRDVLRNDAVMGGLPCVLSGDFRQILPIVVDGFRPDTVNATLKR